jgi:LmbE family N-acetylglucosaminyl deacetylase
VWLDFPDAQYECPADVRDIGAALESVVAACEATQVLLPLGLFHSDHRLAHRAALSALRARPRVTALAYEDVPYRARPGLVQERLAGLSSEGVRATPAPPDGAPGSRALKAQALDAYASQWLAFGGKVPDDAAQPERLWILEEALNDGR